MWDPYSHSTMRVARRAHGFMAAALVVIAVAAVLGHVCVLPGHVHAAPVDEHGSHDGGRADDSVHAASCDALKSTSPTLSTASLVATTPLVSADCALRQRAVHVLPPRVHAESPPLFLLHSALLI